jgi:hypothetical protein
MRARTQDQPRCFTVIHGATGSTLDLCGCRSSGRSHFLCKQGVKASIPSLPMVPDCCQHCCHERSQLPMPGGRPGTSAQHVTSTGRFWTVRPLLRICGPEDGRRDRRVTLLMHRAHGGGAGDGAGRRDNGSGGRLTQDELDARVDQAFTSRT